MSLCYPLMIVRNWCPLLHIWFEWWTFEYQKCNWMKLCLLTWLPKTDVKKVHPLASVKNIFGSQWRPVAAAVSCSPVNSLNESPLFHWNPFQHDDDILFCRYVSAVQGCRLEIVKRRWGSASQIGFSAPPQQPPALKKPFKYSYSPHPLKTLLKPPPPENPPQTPWKPSSNPHPLKTFKYSSKPKISNNKKLSKTPSSENFLSRPWHIIAWICCWQEARRKSS